MTAKNAEIVLIWGGLPLYWIKRKEKIVSNTSFSAVYDIRYDENASGRFARVVPTVVAAEGHKGMVIASLEVDGIELIPSARLEFSDGNRAVLPEFRIFRPIPDREYGISLHLHLATGVETLKESIKLQ